MQQPDPIQEFLRRVQEFTDREWPARRDNLQLVFPGVPIPTRLIVPGLIEEAAPAAPVSDKGEQILGKAASKRGMPYQWGGTGNPSYDCSGLTQWAAGELDIRIGRTTYDQIKDGVEVPFDQVRVGDLVFSRFSDTDCVMETPEHVSIWAGNGKVFEAGDPIGYYNWGERGYVRVRRIV